MCLRRICHSRQVGACPPFLPQCLQHCTCASGGPFFSALPEKNGEKRGALGRVDFYRTATTEAPKLATSCKRTSSPARNYVCPARQSNAPNLPLVASESLPTMPTTSKTKVTPTFSPELPTLRTNSRLPRATAQRFAPAVTRNKSSSRLRRTRSAVPSSCFAERTCKFQPRGINPKKGAAAPFIGRRGIVKGAHRKAPLTAFLYTAGGAFFPRGKERGAEPPLW